MARFGKVCLYVIVSLLLSYISYKSGNGHELLDKFVDGLVPLLSTLAAIYITAISLIVIEFNRAKERHPSLILSKTIKEIKRVFTILIILIPSLFIVLLIVPFLYQIFDCVPTEFINIAKNAFAIAVFGYYLEAIFDIGISLFDIIDFNNK